VCVRSGGLEQDPHASDAGGTLHAEIVVACMHVAIIKIKYDQVEVSVSNATHSSVLGDSDENEKRRFLLLRTSLECGRDCRARNFCRVFMDP
jgi:hypothetical protein